MSSEPELEVEALRDGKHEAEDPVEIEEGNEAEADALACAEVVVLDDRQPAQLLPVVDEGEEAERQIVEHDYQPDGKPRQVVPHALIALLGR